MLSRPALPCQGSSLDLRTCHWEGKRKYCLIRKGDPKSKLSCLKTTSWKKPRGQLRACTWASTCRYSSDKTWWTHHTSSICPCSNIWIVFCFWLSHITATMNFYIRFLWVKFRFLCYSRATGGTVQQGCFYFKEDRRTFLHAKELFLSKIFFRQKKIKANKY